MPKQNKKSQPRPKKLYRVRNWPEYDKALVKRGSITFWFSDGFEKRWLAERQKRRGGQFDYTDAAIVIMLTIKAIFRMSNRSVEGFVQSWFEMAKINLPVPDHSTLSRRAKNLPINLTKTIKEKAVIVMDSTGLKVYSEGEWKVRQHGVSKRRTWLKLHVGIDPQNGKVQAAMLTENSVSDDTAAVVLLDQIETEIEKYVADGAYDTRKVYDRLDRHSPNAKTLIPPRKSARIWKHGNTKAERVKRDENVRAIRQKGRKKWKQESGYHVRSLVETTMFRLKTIFGDKLSARIIENQKTEALIRCVALNRMTQLGMPQTYKVA